MKSIIILALITLSLCSTQIKFLDNTTGEFKSIDLSDSNGKGDVTITTNCLDNPAIKNTSVQLQPTHVKLNANIDAKVEATALQAVHVHVMAIEIVYNGRTLATLNQDINKDYAQGQNFEYTYQNKIPFFLLGGNYEIRVYLVDTAGKHLSCLKLAFSW